MTDWEKITCREREELLRDQPDLRVSASKTDIGGEFGEPEIYTEWSGRDEVPVLREHRWPAEDFNGADEKPCEHYKAVKI